MNEVGFGSYELSLSISGAKFHVDSENYHHLSEFLQCLSILYDVHVFSMDLDGFLLFFNVFCGLCEFAD